MKQVDTTRTRGSIRETHRIGVDLMITDAKVALTFLDMARTSATPEDRAHNIAHANRAYRSILGFMERLKPDEDQASILTAVLEQLVHGLEAAGVPIG